MTAAILALSEILPPYSLSQKEICERLIDLMNLDDESAWMMEKIYKNSSIERRFSVLPDILHSHGKRFIGMSERNAIYKNEAPQLAEKAGREAIAQWGKEPKDITHIISVSCTGAITPGIECIVAERIGLHPHISLLGINFMGCHGAFKALKVATKIALENPKNRILVICTELCSLHFKSRGDIESIVIDSLFADGAAAFILGREPKACEEAIFWIEKEASYVIQNSACDMTWDASDEGFDMTLSRKVPCAIGAHMEPFIQHLIQTTVEREKYEWAIHPGGRMILETVEQILQLDRASTLSSWNTLSRVGNLSSATFLFVLQDIYRRKISKKKIIGLGFGPGLVVEGLILS